MSNLHKYFLIIGIMLGLTAITLAQNEAPTNAKKPITRSYQGPSVPFVTNPPNSVMGGDMAYGWEAFSTSFISMPMPAGTPWTTIGSWSPAPGYSSSAIRGGDGNYYFIDPSVPSVLYTMDPNTGVATMVGPITGMETGANVNGIAYNPVNDTYYLCGGVFLTSNNLYSFDITTLTATLVGSFVNATGGMISIAINASGVGYGYDLVDDMGYTFDPITGSSSALGALGFNANYAQDMDIDQATGTIYLASYNGTTSTAQLRTMDPNTGATTVVYDWGSAEVSAFAINNDYGPIVGPGPATNPDPPSGAMDVDIDQDISWENPAGATDIEVFFGTDPGNLTSVYSGTPITTYDPGTMDYFTTYYWRVNETDGTGTTTGPTWNFKTVHAPPPPGTFINDPFDDMSYWTPFGPLGLTNWSIVTTNNAGGLAAPELRFAWTPSFTGASYLLSVPLTVPTGHNCEVTFTHFVNYYGDPCGPIGLAVTTDGGTTFTSLWEMTPTADVGPQVETVDFVGTDGMQLAFYYNGNSFNIDYWYIDDVLGVDLDFVPVELTSFNADVNDGNVLLSWSTATETNNKGFEVQKNSGNGFEVVGFVQGNGTSTQAHTYSYADNSVESGQYSYRLRQVDFDGTSEFSNVVEVDVTRPDVYSLAQNYPNPFNPSTQINFSLAVDSKVKLTVFDVLGQEVATLLNNNITAGAHSINFNASNLNSGVYLYKIEAKGVDGSNFTSVKKMLLTK